MPGLDVPKVEEDELLPPSGRAVKTSVIFGTVPGQGKSEVDPGNLPIILMRMTISTPQNHICYSRRIYMDCFQHPDHQGASSYPCVEESHKKYFILFVETVSLHLERRNKCIYALTPGLADGRERQLGTRTRLVTASEIQCLSAFALGENEESSVLPDLSSPPEPPQEQEKFPAMGRWSAVNSQGHRITDCPELEGTHQDHPVQLLALSRTPQ
ncbi:hypothetical protein DUI87_05622 [Hirundo rustica rustica]|uniref:Uncharacterized protein n=1 Tax=Hirundo rustica rustica TaxID=333673 RepID=A0A3M0KUS6_HIRRU|nr:hypothetical protein DUI87_05622 [Hirundo rustica rustica]